MQKTKALESMYPVQCSFNHGMSPIPQEGQYDEVKDSSRISGFSHSAGTCTTSQGVVKLTINVKKGIIEEALIETVGCSGMTHAAGMAAEILPGKNLMEALNINLVCDAFHVAMREMFISLAAGRSQTAFTKDGLSIGAGFEDLGPTVRSMVGTAYGTVSKGPRYLEVTEGYVTRMALDENDLIIGYEYVNLGRMMNEISKGLSANEALEKASGTYGRYSEAVRFIDPRKE
jgi:NifU-like protein involved in Fe-S cluster formation